MSEYNEALSRLEAPERPFTPRYWKHIPYLPYPEHTSTKEYNRILAESRFSKLPKYSISQRFYITDQDVDMDTYYFDLDKSFVNATGDRKSIAIRNIHFDSMFKRGSVVLENVEIQLHFPAGYKMGTDKINHDISDKTGKYTISKLSVESVKDLLAELASGVKSAFEVIVTETYGKNKKRSIASAMKNTLPIINVDSRTVGFKMVMFNLITGDLDMSNPDNWPSITISCGNDLTTKLFIFNDDSKELYFDCLPTKDDKTPFNFTLAFPIPGLLENRIPSAVCSTINPYSCQNIIGSLDETHDMLNKI